MKNLNINFISGSFVENLFIIRHELVGDGLKAPYFRRPPLPSRARFGSTQKLTLNG